MKRPASSPPPHLHKLSMLSVVNLKEAFTDGEAGKRRLDKNGVVVNPLKPFSLQTQRDNDRLGECWSLLCSLFLRYLFGVSRFAYDGILKGLHLSHQRFQEAIKEISRVLMGAVFSSRYRRKVKPPEMP